MRKSAGIRSGSPISPASVAGSAREVIGYLDAANIGGEANFTLIDQDQGALELCL